MSVSLAWGLGTLKTERVKSHLYIHVSIRIVYKGLSGDNESPFALRVRTTAPAPKEQKALCTDIVKPFDRMRLAISSLSSALPFSPSSLPPGAGAPLGPAGCPVQLSGGFSPDLGFKGSSGHDKAPLELVPPG